MDISITLNRHAD